MDPLARFSQISPMEPSMLSSRGSLPIPTTPPQWLSLSVGATSAIGVVEGRSDQAETIPVGKGLIDIVRSAAIAGIAILALAGLSLALPIFTPRSHRARRPTALPASFPEPATPVPRLLQTAEDSTRGLYLPKPSEANAPTPRSSPELTP